MKSVVFGIKSARGAMLHIITLALTYGGRRSVSRRPVTSIVRPKFTYQFFFFVLTVPPGIMTDCIRDIAKLPNPELASEIYEVNIEILYIYDLFHSLIIFNLNILRHYDSVQ